MVDSSCFLDNSFLPTNLDHVQFLVFYHVLFYSAPKIIVCAYRSLNQWLLIGCVEGKGLPNAGFDSDLFY